MFLNFMLELKLRPYAGVDLNCLFPEDVSVRMPSIRGWWERMLMGIFSFPLPGYEGSDGGGEDDLRQ